MCRRKPLWPNTKCFHHNWLSRLQGTAKGISEVIGVCSVGDVVTCIGVFLYIVYDVQWKCAEGSHCGLIPSAVTTVGSVDCGNLPKVSVRLLEFSSEISFEVKGRGVE
jgi:hypothetical protein